MGATPMSPEVRLQGFAAWYNGASLVDVGKDCDVSVATIDRWIVEDGWKAQREVLRKESFRYTVDSLVSNKNRGMGLLMQNFPKIMEQCATSLADPSLAWRTKKEVASVLKSTLESCRMMFGNDENAGVDRRSGTTSGPIALTNVKDDIIDV